MDKDITINLEGFSSNEDANKLGMFAINASKIISENYNLNISNLKKILITFDFEDGLKKTTSSYNHSIPATFTQRKQARGMGQLVSKINPSGFNDEYTLVLSVDFFSELFDEDGNFQLSDDGIKSALHRLHHELIHVHEKNSLTCLDPSYRVNFYGTAILIPATRVWSEYLANYMSSQSVTDLILVSFIDILETVLQEIPEELTEIANNFRAGEISLDEMFLEVKMRVELLINSYGYAMGYVHGLGVDLSESFPDVYKLLSESVLNLSLLNLSNELKFLMEKFNSETITNYTDFYAVAEIIEKVYSDFGVRLECNGFLETDILNVYVL